MSDIYKVCPSCNRNLPKTPELFPTHRRKGKLYIAGSCKACVKARKYKKNKRTPALWYIKQRLAALIHYSNGKPKCKCCSEELLEFLAIDHINGGGNKHRREIGSGNTIYRWLKKNGYPSGFQVLCHNCNMAKAFYGRCPHEKNRETI